jgi:hypothetical protein
VTATADEVPIGVTIGAAVGVLERVTVTVTGGETAIDIAIGTARPRTGTVGLSIDIAIGTVRPRIATAGLEYRYCYRYGQAAYSYGRTRV